MQQREAHVLPQFSVADSQEASLLHTMMQQLYDGIADACKPVVSIERIEATTLIALAIFNSLGEETVPQQEHYVMMRLFELKIAPLIGDAKQRLTCPMRIALECSLRLLHSKFLLITRRNIIEN